MIVTELVIARHAEAACNAAGIVGGPIGCTGLTDNGKRQAKQLAERLAAEHHHEPFTAFYTTRRLRVAQTADACAAALGMEPTSVENLLGLNHGSADGTAWSDAKAAFGGPPQHAPNLPYADGAEPWTAYLDRTTTALGRIIEQDAGGKILIIAHGETIETAYHLLMELPSRLAIRVGFATDHTSLTRFQHHLNRLNQDRWLLTAHNDTSHLAGP